MEKRQEAPLLRGSMEREGSVTMEGRERAMREKRLYEASLSGSVDSLNELMEEDRLTLARVCVNCFNETPLHIAAMLGHSDFAKLLLSLKPDLVTELDSQGFSPLHLASVNGYVEIVKNLLSVKTDICLIRDQDGRTPLHLAAMKGRVDVIKELVGVQPEAIEYMVDRGDTLLHACAKHNRLEALKLLVEIGRIDDAFINCEDDDGNTVLHVATVLKQMETIKYLLSKTGVKVNAVNGNGFTALDTIEHTPRDFKGMEIRECLLNAGALRARNIPSSAPHTDQVIIRESELISPVVVNLEALGPPTDGPRTPTIARQLSRGSSSVNKKSKNEEWLNKRRDALMVTATVIAAMAYQAGLNPPGGLWQEDEEGDSNVLPKYAGESILAYHSRFHSNIFWVCNTVSFVASLSIILLIGSEIPRKRARKIVMWILMVAMWVTITSMLVTYLSSIAISTSSFDDEIIWNLIFYSGCIWLAMIGVVLLVYIGRFLRWSSARCNNLERDFQDLCLKVKEMSKCTKFVKLSSHAPLN